MFLSSFANLSWNIEGLCSKFNILFGSNIHVDTDNADGTFSSWKALWQALTTHNYMYSFPQAHE